LWLVVFAPNARYYPQGQTGEACEAFPAEASNGSWNSALQLSEKGHPSEKFDIILTLVEPKSEGDSEFRDYLRQVCVERAFPGIPVLPGGVTKVASVSVKTSASDS
jgi:hypothetical protein